MIEGEEQAKAYVATRCDSLAMERLANLVTLLAQENDRQNLVSRGSLNAIWLRHVADSVQLLDHLRHAEPENWLDLGSGAGFPGLVIAIVRPSISVTLIESRRLRVEWLQRATVSLGLSNVYVDSSRVETAEDGKFAVISARAFAPLPKLLDLATRFSTSDTEWLLPKGRSAAQEVAQLSKVRRAMFHVEPSLTDPEAGIIVGRLAKGSRS